MTYDTSIYSQPSPFGTKGSEDGDGDEEVIEAEVTSTYAEEDVYNTYEQGESAMWQNREATAIYSSDELAEKVSSPKKTKAKRSKTQKKQKQSNSKKVETGLKTALAPIQRLGNSKVASRSVLFLGKGFFMKSSVLCEYAFFSLAWTLLFLLRNEMSAESYTVLLTVSRLFVAFVSLAIVGYVSRGLEFLNKGCAEPGSLNASEKGEMLVLVKSRVSKYSELTASLGSIVITFLLVPYLLSVVF